VDKARKTGIALTFTSVGVLVVVLRNLLDVSQTVGLMMLISGAVLAVVGIVLMWRADRG
jgi:hypothetical protein